jgi:hypothetical protein
VAISARSVLSVLVPFSAVSACGSIFFSVLLEHLTVSHAVAT